MDPSTVSDRYLPREVRTELPLLRRRPGLFIVGAPKCGTSAMVGFLGAHPDVFIARKEMHAFGSDLHFGKHFYRRDLKAYLAEFGGWTRQVWAGESSVWYLFSRRAAAEIKAFNPDSRIIIMLRDPVEMLHSLYYQYRCDGNEQLPTFDQALGAEADRRAGKRIARQAYFVQGLLYREVVRYADQVRRYFDVFGRDRVRVIIYDDFVLDAAGTYRDTLEFLEISSSRLDNVFKVVNPSSSVRSAKFQALLNDPAVRSAALALRPWLPRSGFRFLQRIDGWLKTYNTRSKKRPPIGPQLRASLRREFAPEVERLSELLGRDLTYWSKEAPPRTERFADPGVRVESASSPIAVSDLS